jgi:hypothetical protein
VSRAKRVFCCFAASYPNEGASFSKDFAISRQTRDDFVERLFKPVLFLSQRARTLGVVFRRFAREISPDLARAAP